MVVPGCGSSTEIRAKRLAYQVLRDQAAVRVVQQANQRPAPELAQGVVASRTVSVVEAVSRRATWLLKGFENRGADLLGGDGLSLVAQRSRLLSPRIQNGATGINDDRQADLGAIRSRSKDWATEGTQAIRPGYKGAGTRVAGRSSPRSHA